MQLLFAQSLFQPLAPTFQGAMNGGGRRRQTSLKDLKSEAYIGTAFVIAAAIGSVHLVTNVGCHTKIEVRFCSRQCIGRCVGAAFREQWSPVEPEQLFLC